jgi:hypothetical protein
MSRRYSIPALLCILLIIAVTSLAYAQHGGRRIDNGQQYWNNQRQWQNRNFVHPQDIQSRTPTFQNTGNFFPNSTARPQPPFSGAQPAPTAFQRYWPLMVYPNSGLGYWY